jgi:hypothetical protein
MSDFDRCIPSLTHYILSGTDFLTQFLYTKMLFLNFATLYAYGGPTRDIYCHSYGNQVHRLAGMTSQNRRTQTESKLCVLASIAQLSSVLLFFL